jgi:hypothetical protein
MIPYEALDDDGLLAMHSYGRHWLFRDKMGQDLLTRSTLCAGGSPGSAAPTAPKSLGKESPKCAAVRMWFQHAQETDLW